MTVLKPLFMVFGLTHIRCGVSGIHQAGLGMMKVGFLEDDAHEGKGYDER